MSRLIEKQLWELSMEFKQDKQSCVSEQSEHQNGPGAKLNRALQTSEHPTFVSVFWTVVVVKNEVSPGVVEVLAKSIEKHRAGGNFVRFTVQSHHHHKEQNGCRTSKSWALHSRGI
jgi:hypothetical protein